MPSSASLPSPPPPPPFPQDMSSEGFSAFPPSSLSSLAAHSPLPVPYSSPSCPSITDITVRCTPSAVHGWLTWEWALTHPSLPPTLPPSQSFLAQEPSLPSLTLLSQGNKRLLLTFSPGWPPKAMYQAVANACLAIRDLSALQASIPSPSSPLSFFEVPLQPTTLGQVGTVVSYVTSLATYLSLSLSIYLYPSSCSFLSPFPLFLSPPPLTPLLPSPPPPSPSPCATWVCVPPRPTVSSTAPPPSPSAPPSPKAGPSTSTSQVPHD